MAEQERMVKAIVARGRTVDVPFGRPVTVGSTPEGKPVTRQATKSVGPGQQVELPAGEVATLRKLGYLVDPDVAAIAIEGPRADTALGAAA